MWKKSILIKPDCTVKKVAKERSAEAQLALARFYEFGISVPADISKSINFYQTAAAEESEFAKQQLTRLSNQGKPSSNAMRFQCLNQVAFEKVKIHSGKSHRLLHRSPILIT